MSETLGVALMLFLAMISIALYAMLMAGVLAIMWILAKAVVGRD